MRSPRRSGRLIIPALNDGPAALMSDPAAAVLAGLLLGSALVFSGRISSKAMTPEEAYAGLAKVAVFMVVRLFVVVFSLLAFHLWARSGLVPFGIALVGSFLVMIAVEILGISRQSLS